jgi:XRN-Two Binding Domain, XTBD
MEVGYNKILYIIIYSMEKLPHETHVMFEKRRKVYEKAMDLGYNTKDSIRYANIWANITYLGCKYPASLTEISNKLGQDAND